MLKFIFQDIEINYKNTKHDDVLIGGRTIEVFEFEEKNNLVISNPFELLFYSTSVAFAMIKISPANFFLKELLYRSGFYYVTTTIDLYEVNIQTKRYPNPLGVQTFTREKKTYALKEIKKMMLNNFGHGKFFEDFNLKHLAFIRQEEVLNNLSNDSDVSFSLLYNVAGKIVGYFVHKSIDDFENLIFAGTNCHELYMGIGDDVWNSFHNFLQNEGIKKTKTLISLSNTGVLNIYSRLGYKFRRPREQYHFLSHETRNQLERKKMN